jgi:hypothetical protein
VFTARLADPRPAPTAGTASRAVFRPAAGLSYATPDIPGRQGFLPAESGGLAWADETVPVEIMFEPNSPLLRFRLHVLMITPDYPIESLRAELNGHPVPVAILAAPQALRRTLRIGPFSPRPGLNRLRLLPPGYVPVRSVRPGVDDRRNLSIGLLRIDAL